MGVAHEDTPTSTDLALPHPRTSLGDRVIVGAGMVVFVALALGMGDVGSARKTDDWTEGWPRLMPRALWSLFAAAAGLLAFGAWRALRSRRSRDRARRSRLQLTAVALAAVVTGGEWLYWSSRPVLCGSVNHSNPNYPHYVPCWSTSPVPKIHDPALIGGLVVLIAGLLGVAIAATVWYYDPDRPPGRPREWVGMLAALAGVLGVLLGPIGLLIGPIAVVVAGLRYRRLHRSGAVVSALVLGALSFLYALAWITIWASQNPFALFI